MMRRLFKATNHVQRKKLQHLTYDAREKKAIVTTALRYIDRVVHTRQALQKRVLRTGSTPLFPAASSARSFGYVVSS
jgi:hypothetical protein